MESKKACLSKTETQLRGQFTPTSPWQSICQEGQYANIVESTFCGVFVKPFGISKNGHYSFIMPAFPLLELEMVFHMNEAFLGTM